MILFQQDIQLCECYYDGKCSKHTIVLNNMKRICLWSYSVTRYSFVLELICIVQKAIGSFLNSESSDLKQAD